MALYKKSFQDLDMYKINYMVKWCYANISQTVTDDDGVVWWHEWDNHGRDTFCFVKPNLYEWFLLRWS